MAEIAAIKQSSVENDSEVTEALARIDDRANVLRIEVDNRIASLQASVVRSIERDHEETSKRLNYQDDRVGSMASKLENYDSMMEELEDKLAAGLEAMENPRKKTDTQFYYRRRSQTHHRWGRAQTQIKHEHTLVTLQRRMVMAAAQDHGSGNIEA